MEMRNKDMLTIQYTASSQPELCKIQNEEDWLTFKIHECEY